MPMNNNHIQTYTSAYCVRASISFLFDLHNHLRIDDTVKCNRDNGDDDDDENEV